MNYKVAQFILAPLQRQELAHEIYIAQPDADKEALAGKLFALIEIKAKKTASLKIINFLINTLSHSYYQNEKMILRERVASIKIEHIFESALAKTNKKLAEFLQSEKIRLNPGLVNITIGVIYNDSLHFSNLGKNKALLIYKSKTEDGAKYKLADITEQTDKGEAKKPASPVKLFSNVVSGPLPRGGYFIFANETFSEYLSAKQIISIITTLAPAGAAEQIKNTLSKINAYVPFLGIIIKNTAGAELPEIKIKEPAGSRTSIASLTATEEQTEKLLTPSGLINGKKWSSFFNGLTGRLNLKPADKINGKTFLLKDKIFSGKKTGWFSFKKIYNFLKNYLSWSFGLLVYLFKILSNKEKISEFFKRLIISAKNFRLKIKTAWFNLAGWYKNLGRTNKILLSAFLICLIIFSSALTWQNIENKEEKKQAALSDLVAAIEQKQNQIDASLLYNNEAGAKKLLLEVKDLVAQLPQKNQAQKDLYNKLTAKQRVQIEKISRVIRAEAVEIADFTNLNANARPANLALAREKIFAADAEQKTIYSLDLKTKLATAINLTGENISRLDFPDVDKNNNISYFNGSSIILLDAATEKLSSLEIDYPVKQQKIIDFKEYNNRYYYLADGLNGQIYRFSKSGSKLTGGAAWLNSPEDLSDVTGLDINGNIYLLKNNGEVIEYSRGKKQGFSVSAIEPNLEKAAKLIISPANYFYVFEPAGKRLAVFDEKGNFINQYMSDKLNDLKDAQIDETNKKIYFLNDAAVYLIDMIDTK